MTTCYIVCLYTINSMSIFPCYTHDCVCSPCSWSVFGLINIIFFVDDISDKLRSPRNHGCVAKGEPTTFERFTVESGRERGIKVCGNHVRGVSFEEDAERRM